MLYDEKQKQRRENLKRKIRVAAVWLVVLGAMTAFTWPKGLFARYDWQSNTGTMDTNGVAVAVVGGEFYAFARAERFVDRATGSPFFDGGDLRGRLGGRVGSIDPPPSYGFAGFAIFSQVGRPAPINFRSVLLSVWGTVTLRGLTCPLWLFAVAPALLIVRWSRQLRRAGPKESAFPVITDEKPKNP